MDGLFAGGYSERIRSRLASEGTLPDIRPEDATLAATPIDFLGLNVYSRVVVDARDYNPQWWVASQSHPGGNFLANGMEFYPRAVYDAVAMVRRDYGVRLPVYITENGMAGTDELVQNGTVDDSERIGYVTGFLEEIARANRDGLDIRGYYLWTLLDNYEWAAGYGQRFGIVHVDPVEFTRTPKRSFDWYRSVIASRRLDGGS